MIVPKKILPAWMAESPIVLTGASGLLGSHFCRQLSNFRNLVPVSFSHPVTGFSHTRVVDLRDRQGSHRLLETIQPRIILHCAAETNVEKCEKTPAAAVRANVDMTNYLVEWIQRYSRDTLLVFISTDQVYHGEGPHQEQYIYPRNVYALTKCAAESLVRSCPRHLILRANFVGWSPRGAGFVNWLFDRLTSGEPLTLVEDVKFNPLSAEDLVVIVLELICRQVQGTFNVGAGGPGWSKAEFGFRLGGELGLNLNGIHVGKIHELGLCAMRPNDMTMDVRAAETALSRSLPTMEDTIFRLVSEAKAMRLCVE